MKIILSMITGLFLFQASLLAQIQDAHFNCSHDAYQHTLQQDVEYQKQMVRYNQSFANYILASERNHSTSRSVEGILTLPTVIHFVQGEAKLELETGLTDGDIAEILHGTNDLFQHASGKSFDNPNLGVDTEIEFCLTKTDPDNQITNGIVRHAKNIDPNTPDFYEFMEKTLWDVAKYNNIYVFAESLDGYCSLYLSTFDATIFSLECFASDIITHEMGHYLSLEHTFKDGCDNDNCLFDGDYICDTPPKAKKGNDGASCDVPNNSCSSDILDKQDRNPYRSTSKGGMGDQPDMVENYMDNTRDCWAAFTKGQKRRMRFNIKTRRYTQLHNMACEEPIVAPNPICDATMIECGSTYSGSTEKSSYDNPDDILSHCGSGGVGAPNEFYKFKGNDKEVTISLCEADYDTRIDVYSVLAGTCGMATFTCVGGNDDFCKLQSSITFHADKMYDYYIMVHGYLADGKAKGAYELAVNCQSTIDCEEPKNSDCGISFNDTDEAKTSHSLTVQEFGSPIAYEDGNNACTTTGKNPSCDIDGEVKDVWYRFKADGTDVAIKVLLTGDMPAKKINLALYDNCGGEELYCQLGTEEVTATIFNDLIKGRAYFIQVWSTQKEAGDFKIAVCEVKGEDATNEEPISNYSSGISSTATTQLVISPNPSTTETTLQYFLTDSHPITIQVFDLNGQLMLIMQPQSHKGWNKTRLKVDQLHAGMYYMVLNTNQERLTRKIMVLNSSK